jgi:hypothetical protein
MVPIEPCVECLAAGGWWQAACAARCMCVRHLLRSYLQPPHTYYSCSQPTSRSLSVLISIPTTTPLSYPITSPSFRHLLSLHYGALQPPTWWSYYAATYSPPTYHFCSQPASRSLSVLLPIPTTITLSYPATSPPFRRLICLHYGALQPAVTHTMAAPPAPFPALLSPNLRDLVTAIDPAQPELPSYLLAS